MKQLQRLVGCAGLWLAACSVVVAQQQVEARRYVVSSGHREATAAGVEVLRQGGNVVDAAIAVSLCLGVAEPCGSGLGGTLVMLYREAATQQVYCVQACCSAPHELNVRRFARLPLSKRRLGYAAVGVPGLPAGLWAAHERWGSRAWKELVAPAAALAEHGVEVTEGMRELFAPDDRRLRRDPEAARLYLADGDTLAAGSIMTNPDLAATLRRLAAGGVKAFYQGETAERIVAAAQANGSSMTLDDLRGYAPDVVKPLSVSYRGNQIYTSPPPQIGGLTVLLALKALEKQSWEQAKPRNADYVDAIGRVLLSVYPKAERVGADIPTGYRAARRLLAPASVAQMLSEAAAIQPTQTRAVVEQAGPTLDDLTDASTSHLVVADNEGNMISLTQSLSYHFGASVVVPGTGILLNNTLNNFTLASPDAPNYVAPGKRPRSAVAPIIVTRGATPLLALGIPGGQRIPTTSIQMMVDVLDFKLPLPAAFKQPRFHVRRALKPGDPTNIVDVEGLPSADMRRQLASDGWRVVVQRRDGHYFGGGNGVAYQAGGTLLGVADLRRNNLAVGD